MYDIAVIGAGWAGFTAAREAAGHGLKTCLIEQSLLGGTCLNAGCIPTKLLVQSARILLKTQKSAEFGISSGNVSFDLGALRRRSELVIAGLRRGMETRLKGIDAVTAEAQILDAHTVKAGGAVIETGAIIICSGSLPRPLDGFAFDGSKILSSDDTLKLDKVPASLLIIGGGSIGCEFASAFAAFGSDVTVAEACPNLVPGTDRDVARKLESAFRRRGIKVVTGADASTLDVSAYEKVIVSIGRRPRIDGAGVAGIGIEKGRIVVDEYLQTTVPGIYAAGDCTGKLMLAHYAALQGRFAALNACGQRAALPQPAIPSCIFTSPEIACIGISEEEAMKSGVTVREYQFDFFGSGMAHVMGETQGMIKILADAKTDAVVGAFVIGPNACELGGTLTLAVQSGMKAARLRETVFAHPSLTESISEMLQ